MGLLSRILGTDGPTIERVRHDLRIRSVEVADVEQITPGMRRIHFTGADLADFTSIGFDDHVKLLVPTADGQTERRSYTPRKFNRHTRTLSVDFAEHDAGTSTSWARDAKQCDRLRIAGPKSSRVISGDVGRWLLIGDETALPAIGRHIEEAGAGVQIASVVAVTGSAEEQLFGTAANAHRKWVHRPLSSGGDPAPMLHALRDIDLTADTFVWIAAEAKVARAIRDWLVDSVGHARGWVKAGGYWVL